MMRMWVSLAILGAGLSLGICPETSLVAAVDAQVTAAPAKVQPAPPPKSDFIEARQFQLSDARTPGNAGQPSIHQTVTAWQVVKGMWNGQALDGLSLILVQTVAEDGTNRPLTNCFISHLATPAQRRALVNAYASTQFSSPAPAAAGSAQPIKAPDTSRWRVEPAVIEIETQGERIVVHLGTIA